MTNQLSVNTDESLAQANGCGTTAGHSSLMVQNLMEFLPKLIYKIDLSPL